MTDLYTPALCLDMGEHMTHKNALILACEKSGDTALLQRARKMEPCGRRLLYAIDGNGETRLESALFCRQRICPVCQWRRSLKAYRIMTDAVERIGDACSYQLLTISRPNVRYEQLKNELVTLYKNASALFRLDRVKAAIKGFYRALEVTYNPDRDDYHPHFHIITAVNKSYYHSRNFIKRDDMVAFWNEVNGHDRTAAGHDLVVDWRKVRDLNHDISEVAKYCCKPFSGYAHRSDAWDIAITQARMTNDILAGKRLVQTGGVIREAIRAAGELRAAEQQDGDLCDDVQDDNVLIRIAYRYCDGVYVPC